MRLIPRPSRLVLRIYVVMLLAIAVVVAVLVVTRPKMTPPPPPVSLEAVGQTVLQLRDDPRALKAELERVKRENHLDVTLYGPEGKLIASAVETPPPPASTEELQRPHLHFRGMGPPRSPPSPSLWPGDRLSRPEPPSGPRGRMVVVPLSAEGDHIIVQFERPRPPRPDTRLDIIIVLICLALASLVLARMIARPLHHISRAARAFGAGDLTARSRLTRQDELGELSGTFDEMAERITQLLGAQRELLASISHELRTPLSRIRVALDLAAEGDAASAHQSLRDIAEDLGELEELVNDVLAMARLEVPAGGPKAIPPLRKEEVSARAVADRALARFTSHHPARPLELHLSDEPLLVQGDPNLLRRVLENVLDNAHKYSAPTVPIRVGLDGEGDDAVFTVTDRGQGIGPDDLPYVFEPFFRADRSRTRGTGGVGLGLALSKRIVDAHGGRIELESELDEGTTVTFRVPLTVALNNP
jgi:two-component system OmpR family sensor kinase